MKKQTYTTLKRELIDLNTLNAKERALVDELIALQKMAAKLHDYCNAWMPRVTALYKSSGLSRREIIATPVWRIAQDLNSRLMIRDGRASPPDYRDELKAIIEEKFPSQRAFCDATGISEDMLSHVLARRKHLASDTLSTALERIGYRLHIAPLEESN